MPQASAVSFHAQLSDVTGAAGGTLLGPRLHFERGRVGVGANDFEPVPPWFHSGAHLVRYTHMHMLDNIGEMVP